MSRVRQVCVAGVLAAAIAGCGTTGSQPATHRETATTTTMRMLAPIRPIKPRPGATPQEMNAYWAALDSYCVDVPRACP